MFKLNKRLKNKWLKALRSGEYKQGKGSLCIYNKKGEAHFCCLGVFADVAIKEPWKTVRGSELSVENNTAYVPINYIPMNVQHSLTNLNDGVSYTFKRIANWIEKNL